MKIKNFVLIIWGRGWDLYGERCKSNAYVQSCRIKTGFQKKKINMLGKKLSPRCEKSLKCIWKQHKEKS